jgi:hypothetical protein
LQHAPPRRSFVAVFLLLPALLTREGYANGILRRDQMAASSAPSSTANCTPQMMPDRLAPKDLL